MDDYEWKEFLDLSGRGVRVRRLTPLEVERLSLEARQVEELPDDLFDGEEDSG